MYIVSCAVDTIFVYVIVACMCVIKRKMRPANAEWVPNVCKTFEKDMLTGNNL